MSDEERLAYEAWRARLEKRFSGWSYLQVELGARDLAGMRSGNFTEAWVALSDAQRDGWVEKMVARLEGAVSG